LTAFCGAFGAVVKRWIAAGHHELPIGRGVFSALGGGAAACLIDRSGGKAKVGVKLVALASLKFPSWEPDKLPPHLRDTEAVKPGSRGLA